MKIDELISTTVAEPARILIENAKTDGVKMPNRRYTYDDMKNTGVVFAEVMLNRIAQSGMDSNVDPFTIMGVLTEFSAEFMQMMAKYPVGRADAEKAEDWPDEIGGKDETQAD